MDTSPGRVRVVDVRLRRPITAVERRPQFDLPPMRIEVTEHQLVEREYGCGQHTRGEAPTGVDAPFQYGSRIAAIVVYLYVGQFLSKKRTAQALTQLFGTPLSGGTVAALTARAAGRLAGFLGRVRDKLTESEVVGFDETGLRAAGKLPWVHRARTDKYTLVTCHPKRVRKVSTTSASYPTSAVSPSTTRPYHARRRSTLDAPAALALPADVRPR